VVCLAWEIIEPFKECRNYNPSKLWSKTKINTVEFRNQLLHKDLKNLYQFDYGKGLVFTWANSILEEPSLLDKKDIIVEYDFEDNLTRWIINSPSMQKMLLVNMPYHGDNSLTVELNASYSGWKIVNSPLIPVIYESQYKFELYAKGKDSHNVHAKVMEYNETKEIINAQHMGSIGSGDFDWKKISFNFIPTSLDTKYVQLQLWH